MRIDNFAELGGLLESAGHIGRAVCGFVALDIGLEHLHDR